jgi:hypothetical protein
VVLRAEGAKYCIDVAEVLYNNYGGPRCATEGQSMVTKEIIHIP